MLVFWCKGEETGDQKKGTTWPHKLRTIYNGNENTPATRPTARARISYTAIKVKNALVISLELKGEIESFLACIPNILHYTTPKNPSISAQKKLQSYTQNWKRFIFPDKIKKNTHTIHHPKLKTLHLPGKIEKHNSQPKIETLHFSASQKCPPARASECLPVWWWFFGGLDKRIQVE